MLFVQKLGDVRVFAGCVLVAVIVFFVLVPQARVRPIDWYEDVAFALNPTAARAFAYGEAHLSAPDSSMYDINRAQYYFEQAAAIDPTYPYLYHELARISFLHGNFPLALAQIDVQIALHGDTEANSYYVRGLIEGYMGNYTAAAADYKYFIQFDPEDWASANDYSWVLLQAHQSEAAVQETSRMLQVFPGNPWLLNTNAIALYDAGDLQKALIQAEASVQASHTITTEAWLDAYPGNDPSIAEGGIASFQADALQNLEDIQQAIASSTKK